MTMIAVVYNAIGVGIATDSRMTEASSSGQKVFHDCTKKLFTVPQQPFIAVAMMGNNFFGQRSNGAPIFLEHKWPEFLDAVPSERIDVNAFVGLLTDFFGPVCRAAQHPSVDPLRFTICGFDRPGSPPIVIGLEVLSNQVHRLSGDGAGFVLNGEYPEVDRLWNGVNIAGDVDLIIRTLKLDLVGRKRLRATSEISRAAKIDPAWSATQCAKAAYLCVWKVKSIRHLEERYDGIGGRVQVCRMRPSEGTHAYEKE